ncbi:MAG: ABC transporter permease [Saprospiraceae bacterium]|nr:ABC transporter permease [Saprospiraceae bacterium]MBK8668259.1 ABC transporter permease [Saprospiraceae bacterium]MBL0099262.1 ABC transporter permease [Saprospiraceae bacterium]
MNYLESIKLALGSIKANLLRSLLTLMIIAVGITCLVGILTAIDSILFSMSDNFNRLGANSFNVRPKSESIRSNNKGRTDKISDPIVFEQAMDFKQMYNYGASLVSIESFCTQNATLKYKNKKTNPTVRVVGVDENYINTSAFQLAAGRSFTNNEVFSTANKAILGNDLIKTLFQDKPEKAIGQDVYINSNRYKIIGALKSKGSSSGGSNDKRVLIPLYNSKVLYGYADKSYNVTVSVAQPHEMDDAINHAIGVMRNVRKLKVSETNDFEIRKSDGILNKLKDMTSTLRWSTVVIAMLTLLGASIGLMNIMLVSVTERTKEIGIRKALGATRKNVLMQFLTEAIVICLMGGIVGVLLGILMGFGVSVMVEGRFFIPWNWMILGFSVCIIVGLVSGLYPALKASKLDPIEALRYE